MCKISSLDKYLSPVRGGLVRARYGGGGLFAHTFSPSSHPPILMKSCASCLRVPEWIAVSFWDIPVGTVNLSHRNLDVSLQNVTTPKVFCPQSKSHPFRPGVSSMITRPRKVPDQEAPVEGGMRSMTKEQTGLQLLCGNHENSILNTR